MKCERCKIIEIDDTAVLDMCNCCFEKYISELDIEYEYSNGENDNEKKRL